MSEVNSTTKVRFKFQKSIRWQGYVKIYFYSDTTNMMGNSVVMPENEWEAFKTLLNSGSEEATLVIDEGNCITEGGIF